MERISVIIPMYNTEEYIMDCLKSVTEQTYTKLEIIVINDNSSDNSLEIVEEYQRKDSRIKVYSFPQQKGVGAARNFGVSKATGKYIYFLDSDDYLPPETLSILKEQIGTNDVVVGSMRQRNLSSSFVITFRGHFNPVTHTEDKFNVINNLLANNYLIRRDFISKHEIKHSENVRVFSDLYFLIPLIQNVEYIQRIKEAVYFKRKRNDPILNPSLSQLDGLYLSKKFLTTFIDLKRRYKKYNDISNFLDKAMLNYYRSKIILIMKSKENVDKLFPLLFKSVKKLEKGIEDNYDLVLKREIRAIRKGKKQRFHRTINTHRFLRALKSGLKSKRRFYIFLYQNIFLKLPMKKNLVFFESFLGKNYSDSPKYIYEYMHEQNLNYKYVWSFNEQKNIPGKAKQVRRFSLRYFYLLARAKYWVSNSRLPRYLTKREGNIYLQTWHGTPLKRLVFDMDDIYSADPNYKQNFYEQSRRWNYLSSANKYSSSIFKRAFLYEDEILEYGYPRNDILNTKNNEKDIRLLKERMNIPLNKKVVLYAPTWRDDDFVSRGKYNFSLKLDLQKMQKELGDEYIILLRMHYFIANSIDISSFKNFVYDFSNYDDIAELYLVSDILITDYSSVFFDYANLKRPMLFFTYDLERYRDTLRGFYLNIETEVPGPLLKTTDEVVSAIKNINDVNSQYSEVYDDFYNRFCSWDKGDAAKKTVKRIFM